MLFEVVFGVAVPSVDTLAAVIGSLIVAAVALRSSEMLPSRLARCRLAGVSGLLQLRVVWLTISVVAAVLALMAVGLIVGDFPISAGDALRTALWERDGEFDFVVNTLRFPRVTVAVLSGMCLAMSGAIFQGLIGNPLVSPDIIGINSGASVFAVFILVVGADVAFLPYAAFIGAVSTAIVIYLLAWKRGVSGFRLVLTGIGINSLLVAVITFMQVRYPIERVAAAARWQAGTLFGASWDDARTLAVGLAILMPSAFLLMRRLRILQLGDDTAAAMGLRVECDRLALITIGSGLAAVAVAVVGPLGFVALLVPHLARLMAGNLTGGVLVFTALLGGFFLLGADLIAQRLFAPTTLPAGIVTAVLGGPYFLFLLARHNRAV